MRQLQEEKRFHILAGLPTGPSHRRCLWLIIFKSEAAKKLLLRDGCEQYIGFQILHSDTLAPEIFYSEIKGALLDATEEFIAHHYYCQLKLAASSTWTQHITEGNEEDYQYLNNCVVSPLHHSSIPGIAGQIFERYPEANVYLERGIEGSSAPGTIAIRGKFIAMFSQIGPGHHYQRKHGIDTEGHRLTYFKECLARIGKMDPKPESIAFPYYIGCGTGGGSWPVYERELQNFAARFKIKTAVYNIPTTSHVYTTSIYD